MERTPYSGSGCEEGLDGLSSRSIAERRGSERVRTICRIARVTRVDDVGLWRVRNISNEGLMLAGEVAVDVGEELEIAFSEHIAVSGRIVWSNKGRCGVAFSQVIDAAALLRSLAEEQRAEGHRGLRLPIDAEAIMTLDRDAFPIDLFNLSQSGAGFRYGQKLEPGLGIELLLPGGELRRKALVRWSDGERGGLWFTEPLDRADLESIARFKRSGN